MTQNSDQTEKLGSLLKGADRMAGSDFISAFEIVSLSLIWTSGEKATFFFF